VKIYPSYGDSPLDGHAFGYFGSDVWAEDVFGFLSQYCSKQVAPVSFADESSETAKERPSPSG
jgi:hypothetical protein